MRQIEIDSMLYGVPESRQLIATLVEERNRRLSNNEFTPAVVLSHAIAWMNQVVDINARPVPKGPLWFLSRMDSMEVYTSVYRTLAGAKASAARRVSMPALEWEEHNSHGLVYNAKGYTFFIVPLEIEE